jgi:hypothetical protein
MARADASRREVTVVLPGATVAASVATKATTQEASNDGRRPGGSCVEDAVVSRCRCDGGRLGT